MARDFLQINEEEKKWKEQWEVFTACGFFVAFLNLILLWEVWDTSVGIKFLLMGILVAGIILVERDFIATRIFDWFIRRDLDWKKVWLFSLLVYYGVVVLVDLFF